MKKKIHKFGQMLCIIMFMTFLTSLIQIDSTQFYYEVTAENAQPGYKEYKAKQFEDKITIPTNNFKTMNINFQEGKQLEIIFLIQVKEDLPIDIWFVNEDNYLLLSGGAQFLYFIDGTQQQVSYVKKIITLTEYDGYKLVMTNYYNNQTIEVDIAGELRTYGLESNEKTSEDDNSLTSLLFYPFLIAIIILGATVVFLFVKIRKSRELNINHSNNPNPKKIKRNKSKKNKHKSSSKANSKKSKSKKSKQKVPEITLTTKSKKSKVTTNPNSYCGHCGKPVTTPFCTGCGQATHEPLVAIN